MYYSSKEEEIKSYGQALDTVKRFTMKQIYDTIAIAHWGHGTGIDWHIRFVKGLRKGKYFIWGEKEVKQMNTCLNHDFGYVMWTLGERTLIEFNNEDEYKFPVPKSRRLTSISEIQ